MEMMMKITLNMLAVLVVSCNPKGKKVNFAKFPTKDTTLSVNQFENRIATNSFEGMSSNDIGIGKQIMISSSQISSAKEVRIHGCRFDAVISESNDTTYLATEDLNFSTPEKIKVGTKFSELSAALRLSIQTEAGWGYFIELDSKWCIGFCEGNSCTDQKIRNDSQVKWIFKRT